MQHQEHATGMIHVRLDEELKHDALEALGEMGLNLSQAIRAFLTRVARDRAIPFELRVPNATTRAAMNEVSGMERARFASADALFDDLAKNHE